MKRTLFLFFTFILITAIFNKADALIRPEEPLHRAAQEGNLKKVKSLVEKGADVNALGERLGRSSLHWAVG
ncbi:ankyrin repeat domain-containing protein, partial [bacterium]|nr:ankyrin repeat domain-containing protein [bacterium]